MKILGIYPSFGYYPGFAGTTIAPTQLSVGLAKIGVDVTVYTTDADGKGGYLNVPLNTPVDLGGVKVWYFHCDLLPKKAFYSRDLTKKLEETVKDFDLVHVSAAWQWIQVVASRICQNFKIPYIVSTHGSLMDWGLR